ncbi:arginine decarboxylase-like isoform X1 [Phoenix dactylifera]|uniref:Arginine decarboxylase-like isoform X1 n=1 Tax=Phoenix dactylifera TaxID=42345 RepID=A0A8B7MUI1_PHODC|nr:arginine decarboxylase-like isoform X1 [Phoenix dactylifera]XP_017699152.2 arginine decarboxylase-like isoform X1 [Phoenix dactylifera]XP_017699153.2 arginine decarboxylase-like isoform X1 [Phoenix dactylifera]XP_017699154.2 arginine decarboxylase-like isoform X1 [Phoenix dactylifera]XP_026661831.2 arginine decarboxylase-like isoform X1 [Phoenix dactylifera]XP_026661832.2 arginine decarboxylase-like isoform X1 [Phoenix dactylifera]XP_026661833.2 arginine decarboxylase-like isoform X1 [Phoe
MLSLASSHLLQDISWLQSPPFGNPGREQRLVPRRRKPHISLENITRPSTSKLCATSLGAQRTSNAGNLLVDAPTATPGSTAPLVLALQSTAKQDVACFHFPGHNRGKAAPSLMSEVTGLETFLHDLPELPELDDLFSPKGVILDAQMQAAKLFGASETWFLVGGTTCGIQASIMATCSPGEILILPRNSHISATSGLILSGAIPKYIMPRYNSHWDIAGGITLSQVDRAVKELEEDGKTAAAVLLTSPTYHGICSNVSEITKLCHARNIPVIVDEAHGAHFGFHAEFPSTALEQGVDLAVQSTHKVLCSLTQSSMLHMSGNLIDRERISRCLQTLQSSSPSYLLLASLDAARAQLSENSETIFNKAMDLSLETRHQIRAIPGVSVLDLTNFISGFPSIDPLRITLGVSQLGISGYMADEILYEGHHVIPELVGSRSLTFAINLGTRREDVQRLVSGINFLSANYSKENELEFNKEDDGCEPFSSITMRMSPREAFFAKKRKVDIGESLGQICGELVCPYPPGIPLLVPGEVITEEAIQYLLDIRRMGAAISGASDHQLSSMLVCNV